MAYKAFSAYQNHTFYWVVMLKLLATYILIFLVVHMNNGISVDSCRVVPAELRECCLWSHC